jgi:putative PIN family toxin of toxin-antitoxin system
VTNAPAPVSVVDTSVHLAACISMKGDSPNKEVVHRAARGHIVLSMSVSLVNEIRRKLISKGMEQIAVIRYCAQLLRVGQLHRDAEPDGSVSCRDLNDLFLLMLAIVSGAAYIVSVDRDLLAEDCICPVGERLHPGPFLRKLRSARGEPPDLYVSSGASFPKDDACKVMHRQAWTFFMAVASRRSQEEARATMRRKAWAQLQPRAPTPHDNRVSVAPSSVVPAEATP